MKRVLVPIDGSDAAERALVEALELFPEGDIRVLTVTQIKKLPAEGAQSAFDTAVSESERILESAEAIAADHGREIRTTMREGHAVKTIVSHAERNDIDHIVLGSTGQTGAKRVLLGSVAESVLRRAPCPVTVVRD